MSLAQVKEPGSAPSKRGDEVKEMCYPCSAHGHRCVMAEEWTPRYKQVTRKSGWTVLPFTESGCRWFDVALWIVGGQNALPVCGGYVEAAHALAAIEQLMEYHGLRRVASGCASALDGSLVYRVYDIKLLTRGGCYAH